MLLYINSTSNPLSLQHQYPRTTHIHSSTLLTAKMKSTTLLPLLLPLASAHTIFLSVNSGAVGAGVRVPSYDGPINDVSSNDIVCNGGPNPTAKTDTVITLQAGSTVTLNWRHTLTSGPSDVIDASHKGPVMAYMKKVSDAKTDSGVGGGWFKVNHLFPISSILPILTPSTDRPRFLRRHDMGRRPPDR